MRELFKFLVFLFIFLIISGFLNPNDKDISSNDLYPPFLSPTTPWADSVFSSLTPDVRIAQLFMVAAFSNKGDDHVMKISNLVKNSKIGGFPAQNLISWQRFIISQKKDLRKRRFKNNDS